MFKSLNIQNSFAHSNTTINFGPGLNVLKGKNGSGKALHYKSVVLSHDYSWIPISELKVGDLVLGVDNKPAPVLGVYPQGKRHFYNFKVSSGASVLCCKEHLWTVTCCKTYDTITISTEELLKLDYTEYFLPPFEKPDHRAKYDYITSILSTDIVDEAICIKVDSPGNLFITNGYIVTHNTETIEMLNYSLFGSKALRDSMSSYKDLVVQADVVINNQEYRIHRGKKHSISKPTPDGWSELCVGVTSVNDFITTVLSYGLDVYNFTNYCKQHDLLSFSSLKEKSLLNFIELVSGLDNAEVVQTYLKSLKTKADSDKKTLAVLLSDTQVPDFKVDIQFEEYTKHDLAHIKESYVQLYKTLNTYTVALNTHTKLSASFTALPVCTWSLDDFKLAQKYQENKNKLEDLSQSIKKLIPPLDLLDDFNIQKLLQDWVKHKRWLQIQELKSNYIICNNCNTTCYLTEDEMKSLELLGVLEQRPDVSIRTIEEHQYWYRNTQDKYLKALAQYDAISDLFDMSSHVICNYKTVIKEYTEYEKLLDWNSKVEKQLQEVFSNLSEKTVSEVQEKISSMETVLDEMSTLRENLTTYLQQKELYEQSNDYSKKLRANLEAASHDSVFYAKTLEVLSTVKKELQKSCLPLINKSASYYINSMTGGERSAVYVDKDFKLKVDGTALGMVEGSAQVLANIAIRTAVLDTFYHTTFPVLVGDEIDESLHEDRFESMVDSFKRLVDKGYQIILISHKNYDEIDVIDLNQIKG